MALSELEMKKKEPISIIIPVVSAFLMVGTFHLPEAKQLSTKGMSRRTSADFNQGWLFCKKDIARGEAVDLNESVFRSISLPHTVEIVDHRAIDTSSFAVISWYRKHFTLSEKYREKCFRVEFQAVAKVATIWCNGALVGEHKGAYNTFTVDITDHVKIGKENVIAVRVDSRQRKDVPPEGIDVDYMIFGGIVRDVILKVTDKLYVKQVYVMRDSVCKECTAVTAQIVNAHQSERNGKVTFTIIDSAGIIVGTSEGSFTIAGDTSMTFHSVIGPLSDIQLWHPDHPYLYTLHTEIRKNDTLVDNHKEKSGIRTVSFGKQDGRFYINSVPLKLRGLNRHETYPFIGRAAANRLQRRDAEILKYEFGCNIVRCSHYPQDPEFLDRCDEIGLMVLEEIPGWNFVSPKKEWQTIVLDNLENMIIRDRNHPSIISFGVRINQSADFKDLYRETNRLARALDSSRPTHGVRVLDRGSKRYFFEDVWAQNFLIPATKPKAIPWITTESVGHNFPTHSWDSGERLVKHLLAHAAAHDSAAANPAIAGLLGWCAFDYNSSYRYTEENVNYHGVADMFRIPKHAAYFYRSQTDPAKYGPMVYIAHYWDQAHSPNDVWVVSNCDSVELFVNGVSYGGKLPSEYTHLQHPLFVWRALPFKKGALRAVAFISGKQVVETVRKTPGPPVTLSVTADDAVLETGGDMTRIVVAAIDANKQIVPRVSKTVTLKIKGKVDFFGENPVQLEDGKTAFFIKTRSNTPGTVLCSAQAKGMKKGSVKVNVRKRL